MATSEVHLPNPYCWGQTDTSVMCLYGCTGTVLVYLRWSSFAACGNYCFLDLRRHIDWICSCRWWSGFANVCRRTAKRRAVSRVWSIRDLTRFRSCLTTGERTVNLKQRVDLFSFMLAIVNGQWENCKIFLRLQRG